MNPFRPLPLLALLGGLLLGSLLFFVAHLSVPRPPNDQTTGLFAVPGAERRLSMAILVCGAAGGAGFAWLAWRLSDWRDSGQALALLLFGAAVGVTGGVLVAVFMPDAFRQLPVVMIAAGMSAMMGAGCAWWVADSSSASRV